MATIVKKQKTTKKNVSQQEAVPPKRISKFGQMMGSYKGKIKEIGNVWDL